MFSVQNPWNQYLFFLCTHREGMTVILSLYMQHLCVKGYQHFSSDQKIQSVVAWIVFSLSLRQLAMVLF